MNLSLGHLPFYLLLALELTLGPNQPPSLNQSPSGERVWYEWESGDLHPPSTKPCPWRRKVGTGFSTHSCQVWEQLCSRTSVYTDSLSS